MHFHLIPAEWAMKEFQDQVELIHWVTRTSTVKAKWFLDWESNLLRLLLNLEAKGFTSGIPTCNGGLETPRDKETTFQSPEVYLLPGDLLDKSCLGIPVLKKTNIWIKGSFIYAQKGVWFWIFGKYYPLACQHSREAKDTCFRHQVWKTAESRSIDPRFLRPWTRHARPSKWASQQWQGGRFDSTQFV